MSWGMIVVLAALSLAGVALLSLWAAGRFVRRRQGRRSLSIAPEGAAPLDLLFPDAVNRMGLITDGAEALALRLETLALAQRSVDLLYYLWDDDLSGRLIAQQVLAAADRGVRVRVLIDDVNTPGLDPSFKAMDQHPKIEVRLFNPVRNRDWGLLRGLELLFTLLPYNRRMHGKMWITDGRVALIGGRNLGDEYFDAAAPPQRNFLDLDCLLSGQIVLQAAALFDDFWNAPVVVPIRRLLPDKARALRRLRKRLDRRIAAQAARVPDVTVFAPATALRTRAATLIDTPSIRVLADPPEKAQGSSRHGWLPDSLIPMVQDARDHIQIMTPYLVPGTQGLQMLVSLRHKGIGLRLVTNSLSAADNLFVFGAYAWARPRLLLAGAQIFETATQTGPRRMLHAKAAIVDDSHGFVGSFNFDQRSVFLNTEIGVVFSEPQALDALKAFFAIATDGAQGYEVSHNGTQALWHRPGSQTPSHRTDPQASRPRRIVARILGHLPIHRFL